MSLTLQFNPDIKPRGTFSTIVKEYNLVNKHITFSYLNKLYTGIIVKNKDYGINYNNQIYSSATSWCVFIKQQVYHYKMKHNSSN